MILASVGVLVWAAGCGSGGHGVILGASGTSHGNKPPPLETHDPYVFRLTAAPENVPFSEKEIRLPGGEKVSVGLASDSIARKNRKLVGAFLVWLPDSQSEPPKGYRPHSYWLSQGSSVVAGGFRLTVLKIYDMPDASNDAADVRVTPVGQSAQG